MFKCPGTFYASLWSWTSLIGNYIALCDLPPKNWPIFILYFFALTLKDTQLDLFNTGPGKSDCGPVLNLSKLCKVQLRWSKVLDITDQLMTWLVKLEHFSLSIQNGWLFRISLKALRYPFCYEQSLGLGLSA